MNLAVEFWSPKVLKLEVQNFKYNSIKFLNFINKTWYKVLNLKEKVLNMLISDFKKIKFWC
jgi:hypothetical protein